MLPLIVFFFASFTTLAVVHVVSIEFYLYWKYLWLDIPVHILGGITTALGISILPFFRLTLPPRLGTLATYVAMVLMVGLAWEIFEISTGISQIEDDFYIDTFTDLCMDALGAAIGYGIIRSVKKLDS